MKIIQMIKSCAAVAGLFFISNQAMADCRFTAAMQGLLTVIGTMPLQGGNITVGRDVALGSVVWEQTFQSATPMPVTCTLGSYSITDKFGLSIRPLPLSGWVGVPWGANVYQTGVPGIGVALMNDGRMLPYERALNNCTATTGACVTDARLTSGVSWLFIKIGNVSSGTIQGAQLPTMTRTWTSSNEFQIIRVTVSGTLNVVSRTCVTPDVMVQMGIHSIEEVGTLGWKDFSINLNNCPAFHGSFGGSVWMSDGTLPYDVYRKPNTLAIQIDPTIEPFDPITGILNLNNSGPGNPAAATGVGLQIAYSSGDPMSFGELNPTGITPTTNEGESYSIPLKARYVLTEGPVQPGPANATAVFTIIYE